MSQQRIVRNGSILKLGLRNTFAQWQILEHCYWRDLDQQLDRRVLDVMCLHDTEPGSLRDLCYSLRTFLMEVARVFEPHDDTRWQLVANKIHGDALRVTVWSPFWFTNFTGEMIRFFKELRSRLVSSVLNAELVDAAHGSGYTALRRGRGHLPPPPSPCQLGGYSGRSRFTMDPYSDLSIYRAV